MTEKRSGRTDLAVIAVVALALCCALPAIITAIAGIGIAGIVGGWLGVVGGCLVVGLAGVLFVRYRHRCRRDANETLSHLPSEHRKR